MDILIRADSCSDGGRNEPLPMSSAGASGGDGGGAAAPSAVTVTHRR